MTRFATRAVVWLGLVLAACNAKPAPKAAPPPQRIHALLVGVDRYRFADGASFADLRGAVGDALRFKAALASLYGVDVDRSVAGQCDTANATTRTMTDGCATRRNILAGLDAQIKALKSGDTLLFYFAGHGSRYRDDEAFDQDTGYNGTILPTDARNPDGSPGDIFDVELKAIKDRAVAAGIYFVTIFDSCNSATATRDGAAGQARSAPMLDRATPPHGDGATPLGAGGGYWVHLAAAQDGEEAQESASGGEIDARAGVFTSALIDTLTMPGMRRATFGDIMREVQLRVARLGHATQTPSGEGDLTAALGSRSRSPLLFAVRATGTTLALNAGSLSGITPGSRFALYASQADAVARRASLGTATVAGVGPAASRLILDGTAARGSPATLVAEEVAHFFPADLVGVTNDLPPGPVHDAADAVLRRIGFVAIVAAGSTRLARSSGGSPGIDLRAEDGTMLADRLGTADDPGFAARLTAELQKVARVQHLLALRTTGQSGGASDGFAVDTCVAIDSGRQAACPPPVGGLRRVDGDQQTRASMTNQGPRPVYLYLLAIDPRNAVDLILPKAGEFDRKLAGGQPYARSKLRFGVPGMYRFVTIASDDPIRADAFAQRGNGARDIDACVSPLARLVCSASDGSRDPGVTAVGTWSAQVTSVLVTKGASAR